MNKKIIISLMFLGLIGLILAIYLFVLPKNVTVIPPHLGQAIEAVYATGIVEPTIMVPISPRITAHLIELNASEGQNIKQNDILARLDDKEQQATINDLNAKLAFAEIDYNRKQQLLNSKSISRDILDSAKTNVDSLIAQIEKAKAQASYLTLIAPADGLIIRRDGEVGELIPSGQPIFYISCCAPLRITAEVDEEDISQIVIGQEVLIQSDSFPSKIFQGKISSVTPKGDPIARSYRVRISFDDATIPFMIGMTTEVNIIIQKLDNALLIPLTALNGKNNVQIVKDEMIKTVTVETGIQDIEKVQIIAGVTLSDTIVKTFHKDLKDGQRVKTNIYQEQESAH